MSKGYPIREGKLRQLVCGQCWKHFSSYRTRCPHCGSTGTTMDAIADDDDEPEEARVDAE